MYQILDTKIKFQNIMYQVSTYIYFDDTVAQDL